MPRSTASSTTSFTLFPMKSGGCCLRCHARQPGGSRYRRDHHNGRIDYGRKSHKRCVVIVRVEMMGKIEDLGCAGFASGRVPEDMSLSSRSGQNNMLHHL